VLRCCDAILELLQPIQPRKVVGDMLIGGSVLHMNVGDSTQVANVELGASDAGMFGTGSSSDPATNDTEALTAADAVAGAKQCEPRVSTTDEILDDHGAIASGVLGAVPHGGIVARDSGDTLGGLDGEPRDARDKGGVKVASDQGADNGVRPLDPFGMEMAEKIGKPTTLRGDPVPRGGPNTGKPLQVGPAPRPQILTLLGFTGAAMAAAAAASMRVDRGALPAQRIVVWVAGSDLTATSAQRDRMLVARAILLADRVGPSVLATTAEAPAASPTTPTGDRWPVLPPCLIHRGGPIQQQWKRGLDP
jgi:hypothetical protein